MPRIVLHVNTLQLLDFRPYLRAKFEKYQAIEKRTGNTTEDEHTKIRSFSGLNRAFLKGYQSAIENLLDKPL